MSNCSFPLSCLPVGQKAYICCLLSEGQERRRLLDLGFTKDTLVEVVHKSPSGDPVAYFFRGTVIALRSEDAGKILVQAI